VVLQQALNDNALSKKKKKKPTPMGNRPSSEASPSEDVEEDEAN
jgi:hypothetical protein